MQLMHGLHFYMAAPPLGPMQIKKKSIIYNHLLYSRISFTIQGRISKLTLNIENKSKKLLHQKRYIIYYIEKYNSYAKKYEKYTKYVRKGCDSSNY